MKFRYTVTKLFLVAILLPVCRVAADEEEARFPDPTRFEKTISAFEERDREVAPPEGAIVCVGSSTMRGWNSTIEEDLSPLTVIPRGFGGSNFNDLLYYTDQIVLSYKPRAVLVYEGDNDSKLGIAPEKIAGLADDFVKKVHARLPECRIYFLAVKPSINRWDIWPHMQEVNQLLESMCSSDPRLTYIDIATPMLNEEGTPKEDIFMEDQLHMVRKGYEIWRDAIRPVLRMAELRYEQGPIPSK